MEKQETEGNYVNKSCDPLFRSRSWANINIWKQLTKEVAGPVSEGPCNTMENIFSTDSISVQPKGPVKFYSSDCALGKVGYPDFSRTVDKE